MLCIDFYIICYLLQSLWLPHSWLHGAQCNLQSSSFAMAHFGRIKPACSLSTSYMPQLKLRMRLQACLYKKYWYTRSSRPRIQQTVKTHTYPKRQHPNPAFGRVLTMEFCCPFNTVTSGLDFSSVTIGHPQTEYTAWISAKQRDGWILQGRCMICPSCYKLSVFVFITSSTMPAGWPD